MRRTITTLVTAFVLLIPGPALAGTEDGRTGARGARFDVEPIVQEWDFDGLPIDDGGRVGWSALLRRENGINAIAHLEDLRPGGVYTFWWVVIQEDGTFPDDIFLAGGGGRVVGRRGRATVFMSAWRGQPGITGFVPDGVNEITFASLEEPLTATVRIEIAYHGQAADAGNDLPVWLADFWTGAACPPATPNPNPTQPHCPVYFASTHG